MTGHEAHRFDRCRLGERSYVDGDASTLEALHVIAGIDRRRAAA